MPKRELKPGDKIRFVGPYMSTMDEANYSYGEHPVFITSVFPSGQLWFRFVNNPAAAEFSIHSRQITHRLIPRRKAETVSVTREQLAKAWDEAVVVNHQETSYFPKLCKALGFKEPK